MLRSRCKPYLRSAMTSALLAAGLPAAIAADDALPQAQHAEGVTYMTGGVGLTESRALIEHRQDYPLAVEVYAREGGHDVYTAGASVKISAARGDSLLQAQARGPFLFAKLAPGRYAVEVTLDGQTQRKSVNVDRDRTSRAIFVFREASV
jgi:hypothetical protein